MFINVYASGEWSVCGDGVAGRLPLYFCVTHEVSEIETVRVWLWRLEVRGKISRSKIFTLVLVIFLKKKKLFIKFQKDF